MKGLMALLLMTGLMVPLLPAEAFSVTSKPAAHAAPKKGARHKRHVRHAKATPAAPEGGQKAAPGAATPEAE